MATTPTDLVNDYINSRISVPMPKNTQQEGERYNAENEDGNNDEYRKRREFDEEPVPTKAEFEQNQREAEREIEYNSRQRELDDLEDDLEQSEPDLDDDNYLENSEFSGAYFSQPDENEEKSSLGDRIRAKYDSFRASASNTAESLSSTFGASFGAANAKYSRFKRGDPIFAVQSPLRRGKSPSRYISRPGRSISRPYSGGRFGDDFTLGTNAGGYNPYYPVNAGRQSASPRPTMDMYLPSGASPYEGEFSSFNDRKSFKNSEFNTPPYDPFGFGGLSGNGFKNTEKFGDTLMGFNSDLLGGGAGNDTVFGSIGKKESSGFGLDMIIGNNGGMFNTIDPSPRKTTTKRKSASKTAKKSSKKTATKRKSARKATIRGFALP